MWINIKMKNVVCKLLCTLIDASNLIMKQFHYEMQVESKFCYVPQPYQFNLTAIFN